MPRTKKRLLLVEPCRLLALVLCREAAPGLLHVHAFDSLLCKLWRKEGVRCTQMDGGSTCLLGQHFQIRCRPALNATPSMQRIRHVLRLHVCSAFWLPCKAKWSSAAIVSGLVRGLHLGNVLETAGRPGASASCGGCKTASFVLFASPSGFSAPPMCYRSVSGGSHCGDYRHSSLVSFHPRLCIERDLSAVASMLGLLVTIE